MPDHWLQCSKAWDLPMKSASLGSCGTKWQQAFTAIQLRKKRWILRERADLLHKHSASGIWNLLKSLPLLSHRGYFLTPLHPCSSPPPLHPTPALNSGRSSSGVSTTIYLLSLQFHQQHWQCPLLKPQLDGSVSSHVSVFSFKLRWFVEKLFKFLETQYYFLPRWQYPSQHFL